ncbi:MAG: hypothetical protein R3A78_15940 [Polyangiales bacterium]
MSVEMLSLLATVGLVGAAAFASLGAAFSLAIDGGAADGVGVAPVASRARGTTAAAPVAVTAQAAGVEEFARYAVELARGADGVFGGHAPSAAELARLSPREAEAAELAARQGGRLRKVLGDVEVQGNAVRVGVPDFEHENVQALAYAHAEGGGAYFFGTEEGAPGLDGFFMPWRDAGRSGLLGFDGSASRLGDASVGVSLKDLSGSKLAPKPFLQHLRRTLLKNADIVLQYSVEPPPGVPAPSMRDLFVSLRQHSRERVTQTLRNQSWLRDLIAPRGDHGGEAPFRQLLVESENGIVRLRQEQDGSALRAVLVEADGYVSRPAWATAPLAGP